PEDSRKLRRHRATAAFYPKSAIRHHRALTHPPLGGRGSRRAIQSNAAKDSGSRRDDQTQQAISALRRSAHLSDKAPKSTNDAQTGG
ncbi:MAG: hypothetical protein ACK5DR_22435, partial [Planctomyces sp.]